MTIHVILVSGHGVDEAFCRLYATKAKAIAVWEQMRSDDIEVNALSDDDTANEDIWGEHIKDSYRRYSFNTNGDGWVHVEYQQQQLTGLEGRNAV